jgi:hypothetical protein
MTPLRPGPTRRMAYPAGRPDGLPTGASIAIRWSAGNCSTGTGQPATGQVTSVRSDTMRSASPSSDREWVVATATQYMPADRAAASPAGESSNTTQRDGGTPSSSLSFRIRLAGSDVAACHDDGEQSEQAQLVKRRHGMIAGR